MLTVNSNVLAFYSNTFFHTLFSTSNPEKDELTTSLLSWGIGLVNFMLTIPVFWLIDPFGRVALLLATYPAMIVFMLATTLTFAFTSGMPRAAVEVLVFCFTAAFSLGQGPGTYRRRFEMRRTMTSRTNVVSRFHILRGGLSIALSRKWHERGGSSESVWRWYVGSIII